MKVEVYFNLHKKCWSVRHKGKVIKHVDKIVLRDAKFVVQPAGNRKVKETGRKNVHAFVRGEEIRPEQIDYGDDDDGNKCLEAKSVYYNPMTDISFIDEYCQPIFKADYVDMDSCCVADKVLAIGETS